MSVPQNFFACGRKPICDLNHFHPRVRFAEHSTDGALGTDLLMRGGQPAMLHRRHRRLVKVRQALGREDKFVEIGSAQERRIAAKVCLGIG